MWILGAERANSLKGTGLTLREDGCWNKRERDEGLARADAITGNDRRLELRQRKAKASHSPRAFVHLSRLESKPWIYIQKTTRYRARLQRGLEHGKIAKAGHPCRSPP